MIADFKGKRKILPSDSHTRAHKVDAFVGLHSIDVEAERVWLARSHG